MSLSYLLAYFDTMYDNLFISSNTKTPYHARAFYLIHCCVLQESSRALAGWVRKEV